MKFPKTAQSGLSSIVTLTLSLVLIIIALYFYTKNNTWAPTSNIQNPPITNNTASSSTSSYNHCGFEVTSIIPQSPASFPLTVSGIVDNKDYTKLGCAWQMFEGQAGSAQLYVNSKTDGLVAVGNAIPTKVADWTAASTTFAVTFDRNSSINALTPGSELHIIFTEENASGMPPVDTYDLPIILK